MEPLRGNWGNLGTVAASQPQQCLRRAQTCCRHFMVKLSDDGTFILPGDHVTHASLDALVTFHQQKPIRPYGELLTQACGQVGGRGPQLGARECQRLPLAWNPQGFFCRNGFPEAGGRGLPDVNWARSVNE